MSKRAIIIETLHRLTEMGIIAAHVLAPSTKDQTRLSWHVQIDSITAFYMSTTEVEYFIEGCKARDKLASQVNSI